MRRAYVHEAILAMEPGGDLRAPGAAVTTALCGHWDHEPPCPLAPHHSEAQLVGGEVHVRVLFAVEPDIEHEVRQRIEIALSRGQLAAPDGTTSRWHLCSSRHGDLSATEAEHAERLAHE